MIFISITRLRLKSFTHLPAFFLGNEASVKQIIKTPGFLEGKELIDRKLTFWTLTIWKDPSDVKLFRNSSPHKKAMPKLPFWCDEASYVHWIEEEYKPIDWQTVHSKMVKEGKITTVRRPSENQLTKNYPPIKWTKLERTFKASL